MTLLKIGLALLVVVVAFVVDYQIYWHQREEEMHKEMLIRICRDKREECRTVHPLPEGCKPDRTPFEEWCDGRGGDLYPSR